MAQTPSTARTPADRCDQRTDRVLSESFRLTRDSFLLMPLTLLCCMDRAFAGPASCSMAFTLSREDRWSEKTRGPPSPPTHSFHEEITFWLSLLAGAEADEEAEKPSCCCCCWWYAMHANADVCTLAMICTHVPLRVCVCVCLQQPLWRMVVSMRNVTGGTMMV